MNKNIVTKTIRSSNFEILRLICMLLIVAHHYSVHGGFAFDDSISFNRILVQFLSLGGKLGVNCFVLISGYFLCSKMSIRWKGLIKFFFQVTLFSVVIYAAFLITGVEPFAMKPAIKAMLPLLFGGWWFAGAYFVLSILSPFLNQFIASASKQHLLKCIVTLLVLWCVIPTFTMAKMEGNNLAWFIVLYLLAAYIAKHNSNFFDSKKIQSALLITSTALILLSVIAFDILGTKIGFFSNHATYFAGMQNILLTVQSVSLFCVFRTMKVGEIKSVNFVATAMFGVYLIHDNKYFRNFLWNDLLKNASYQESNLLIIHSIVSIVIVFIVCTIVSLLYNLTIDKMIGKIISSIEAFIKKHENSKFCVAFKTKYGKLCELVNKYC